MLSAGSLCIYIYMYIHICPFFWGGERALGGCVTSAGVCVCVCVCARTLLGGKNPIKLGFWLYRGGIRVLVVRCWTRPEHKFA